MKNYFNREEQAKHLMILVGKTQAEDLVERGAVTAREAILIKRICKLVDEFNESVFERLGTGYAKTLSNKAKENTFILAPRNTKVKGDMLETLDDDILRDIVDTNFNLECINCKRTDCLNCGTYKIKSYLGYKGISDDTDLCPFRKKEENIDFDF